MMDHNTTKKFTFDPTCNPDFFWVFRLGLLVTGWKLTQRKFLWNVLFMYGTVFRFLWSAFSRITPKKLP
jgi:hypothetical protein